MMTRKVEWRAVRDGIYEVSNNGAVKRKLKLFGVGAGPYIRPRAHKGYKIVNLCLREDSRAIVKNIYVHHLVAEAFVGPRPSPQHGINHKNGIKDDNRPENLEWATQGENVRHAVRMGLFKRNSKNLKFKQEASNA